MVPVLSLWGKEWEKKLAWSRTHTCNGKINSFPGVVSPGGTFFCVCCFFFPPLHLGRNTVVHMDGRNFWVSGLYPSSGV
jgi:hypothetical protein